jgi:hypothetical protein
VVDHIGTIAKSGTREFFETLTPETAKDAPLIGQFGVGFYASFIVADRVTLRTRRAGLAAEHGVHWESTGEGDYTIETVTRETRGTEVTLHLRPEEDELLSGTRLREILRKYSDHISIPILMKKEQWDATAREQVSTGEDEQINQASALWARSKSRSPKSSITSSTSTWRTISSRRSPISIRRSRAAGRHPVAVHPAAGTLRPVGSRAPPRHQTLRPPRLHHGRCGTADARYSGSSEA